jgi:hypothetical protein
MQEKIELRKFVVKQKGRAEALPTTTLFPVVDF